MRTLTSREILQTAQLCDMEFSVIMNLATDDMVTNSKNCVMIFVAGMIAGRAEHTLAGDADATALYESAKKVGSQLVTSIPNPSGTN